MELMKDVKRPDYNATEQRLANLAALLSPYASISILGINFTLSDLLILALFSMVVLHSPRVNQPFSHARRLGPWLYTGWWLIAVGYLLSALMVQPANASATFLLILQFGFVIVILPFTLIRARIDYLEILRWYLIGLATSIAIGYLIQQLIPGLFEQMLDDATLLGGPRRFGAFLGSNALGKTIAVAIPILIFLYVLRRIAAASMAVALFILLAGSFLAASNAGFILSGLALIGSLTIVFVRPASRKVKSVLLVALVAVVSILTRGGWFTTETLQARVVAPLLGGDLEEVGSYALKEELMQTAWTLIGENPLTGISAGEFVRTHGNGITVHNSYLLTWVEGGILALIGLLVVFTGFLISVLGAGPRGASGVPMWLANLSIVLTLAGMWTGNQPYQRYRFLPLIAMALYFLSQMDARDNRADALRLHKTKSRAAPPRRPVTDGAFEDGSQTGINSRLRTERREAE